MRAIEVSFFNCVPSIILVFCSRKNFNCSYRLHISHRPRNTFPGSLMRFFGKVFLSKLNYDGGTRLCHFYFGAPLSNMYATFRANEDDQKPQSKNRKHVTTACEECRKGRIKVLNITVEVCTD